MGTGIERDSRLDRAEVLRRTMEKRDWQAKARSGAAEVPRKRHRHDERAAHFRLRSARKS